MSCRERLGLRTEAKQLNQQLVRQKALARSHANLSRGEHLPGKSDYEPLLKRRLERLAESIRKHKEEHGCEE
jgi:hypothetical protein